MSSTPEDGRSPDEYTLLAHLVDCRRQLERYVDALDGLDAPEVQAQAEELLNVIEDKQDDMLGDGWEAEI